MLYFLLAFFLLTTIKQWNSPLFHPQAAILGHLLEDSCCPFKYSPHLYRNTVTYTRYDDSFPHLDLIFRDLKIEVGHKTHNTGRKTHNVGCLTHNTTGLMTWHTSYVSSFGRSCCSMSICMTCHPISFASRWHLDVTIYGTNCTMNIASYDHIIVMSLPCNPFKKTKTPSVVLKAEATQVL